jgi:hypothetical protein
MCRSRGVNSGYRLSVAPYQRSFWLEKWEGSEGENMIPKQESNSINPNDQSNRLELTCSGNNITATINDKLVARKTDEGYADGRMSIGLGIIPGSEGVAEARFNDLLVTQR